MLRKLLFYFVITLLAIYATTTFADDNSERITNFNSIIVVNKDASIDVTEEINVYVNNEQIKHGIVRWLPIHYVDSYGIAHRADYQITRIQMNNVNSPYHVEYQNNQFVIYIGDKYTILQPGMYAYTVSYHVYNIVNFFKDGDELYWNVTGDKWTFPIEHATAKVQLPIEAAISNYFGYTGIQGEKGTDFVARKKSDWEVAYATTKSLSPGQGLTIALSWQKGLITKPDWKAQLRHELNPGSYILLGLNALVFCYLLVMWIKHGRDPQPGTIIPLFEPPQNISPEAMRFVKRMGFDVKTFSAAVVNLATKGSITMQNMNNVFTLKKIKDDKNNLPTEEKILMQDLFSKNDSIELKNNNYEVIGKAKNELRKDLASNYENTYFKTNSKYLGISVFLTFIGFISAIIYSDDRATTFFATLWLGVWTAVTCGLIANAYKTINDAIIFKTFGKIFGAIFTTLFSLPFVLGVIVGVVGFASVMPFFTVPLLFVLVVMNVMFSYLLHQHTPAGRKLLDQIEGFKMFLATTERDRLQELNAPNITPEKFEAYLPYAIALDVENAWGEHFNTLLKEAGQQPTTYQPTWYTGTSPWSTSTTAAIPLLIGTALASSLATASVSSSASGGGGSSGGGGGGGGGGGW